jgi:tRNA pseudouridine13 synthase
VNKINVPHHIDLIIGLEKYYIEESWEPIKISIPRPEGFKVIEEISFKPADQWVGESHGKYSVYLLIKRGIDHFTTISEIEKILKRKVHYIGIKDTNAITKQLIYTEGDPLISSYETENFSIKFLGYTSHKLNHTGNIFEIQLETKNTDELSHRLNKISNIKYLFAYIGYQRFGTRRPVTHVIGKQLLLRDWCKAVEWLIGHPFPSEAEIIREARSLFERGKYEEALSLFPNKFRDEKSVLKELIKGKSCFEALKQMKTPIKFFLEAYQSYLYNKYLSRIADKLRGRESDNPVIVIPSDLKTTDQSLKEIIYEEGIDGYSFNINDLKIKLNDLKRNAFTIVRNIKVDDKKILFSLERGMYATILLREISRGDPREFT